MSDRPQKPSPATLGNLKDQELDVLAWCNACGHNAVLALGPLVDRLGRDHPVPDVRQVMRCSECGSREVDTRPAWQTPGGASRYPD